MMDIIQKIDMMLYTPQQHRDMLSVLELAMFIDSPPDVLNEGVKEFMGKVEVMAKKIGIHVDNSGRGGLIGAIYKSSKIMGEFMWHAMRAATGNEESKKRVVELANTEVKATDIMDFLLRLDGLTLHALTGPIHIIDNLTGWHIWANIHASVEKITVKATRAIEDLITVIQSMEDAAKAKAKGLLHGIARVLNLEPEQKLIQATL